MIFCAFQSTLPRREWHGTPGGVLKTFRFQSTLPRREWRQSSKTDWFYFTISIHTPTQGVTKSFCHLVKIATYFNPHSHAGSDKTSWDITLYHSHFNPHSHAGSDLALLPPCECVQRFQSTLPRREWRTSRQGIFWANRDFNPHSHAGSDVVL